jgi:hypothetical protein
MQAIFQATGINKTIFIIVISILTSLTTHSQTIVYHPFPASDANWIGRHLAGTYEQEQNDYDLYISGDTVIGPNTYHKLYQNGHVSFWPPTSGPTYNYHGKYAGAFRQDIVNKKVYLYKDGVDTLAYDYNLNVGDTLPPTCLTFSLSSRPYIRSIDSIIVDNQYRKRFWINGCNYALIEGIGSTFGAFEWIVCPFEGYDNLYCVKLDNQIAWTSSNGTGCSVTSISENSVVENKVIITQNPFSTMTTLIFSVNLKNSTLLIYDSSGKLVKQLKNISGNTITLHRDNLSSGIYFFRLNENDTIIAAEKIVITDN